MVRTEKGRARLPTTTGSLFGLATSVVLLVTPGTVGAPDVIITYYAPYRHVAQATAYTQSAGTCSISNLTMVPSFNPLSGISKGNASAMAQVCSSRPNIGTYQAVAVGDRYVSIPIHWGGTRHNLSLNWSIAGRLSTSLRLVGACPRVAVPLKGKNSQYCDLSAGAILLIRWELINRSGVILSSVGGNGLSVQAYSTYDVSRSCNARAVCTNSTTAQLGNVSGTNWSGLLTHTWSTKELAGSNHTSRHRYALWIQILVEAYTEVTYYPKAGLLGSVVSASVDLSSPGFGAKLNWVRI